MSQRIWNQRRRAVAVLILAIGCGYWTAGACAPTPVVQNTCEQLPDGNDGADGFEIKAGVVSGQGRQLAFTRRVMTNPQDGSVEIETEVTADGELVMTWTIVSTTPNNADVNIEYGPAVSHGGHPTAAFVVEEGVISGDVDGRAMIPMFVDEVDPNNVSFEDGGPLPEMDVDADLEAGLANLFAAAEQTANSCQAQNGNSGKQVRRQIPTQDTGHDSDPGTSGECVGCHVGCSLGFGGCAGGVSAGCAALFICWPCVAACEVIGVAACAGGYATCVALCNSGPCCPVGCGEVACCESGESCLNPDIGLCCGEHKNPCLDKACCENTQTCIDFGPNAGICCEPEDVCGETCCDPTDSCIPAESICCPQGTTPCDDKCCPEGEDCIDDGVCCDPINACGTACCDDLDNCIESLSICCGFDQPPCNGNCCDVGEDCHNNSCCAEELICGNACCPEGTHCEANACMPCPNPTDHACPDGGCCPAGKVCSGPVGTCCDAGEIYCDGACKPANQCIQ